MEKRAFRDRNGKLLVEELFSDTAKNPSGALYRLEQDSPGDLPVLRELYVEAKDPTEVKFAKKHFNSFAHWKRILEAPFMVERIADWRQELDLSLVSDALEAIKEEAEGNTSKSFEANKLILSMAWRNGVGRGQSDGSDAAREAKRGRPSNEQIAKKAHEIAMERTKINEDARRILGNEFFEDVKFN